MPEKPKGLTDDERATLEAKRIRGKRTEDFMEGDFWKRQLGPYMQQLEWEAGMRPPFQRGMTAEQQGMENARRQGVADGMFSVRQMLLGWVQEGEEALKKIEQDNRRKES
jgi:hypothetical protein